MPTYRVVYDVIVDAPDPQNAMLFAAQVVREEWREAELVEEVGD